MDTPIEPRLLRGFRDFLPQEQARRSAMLDTIVRAFETCGFLPLSTPAIEYADILLGKYGEEADKLLYRFKDNGGRDVALRYDLTVPLARVVAQYRELQKPFKRYQVGPVWRAEKPAHGRFREFIQCDADIVGSASPIADADCIAAVILALRRLGVERFLVRIGHRAVLNSILAKAGVMEVSEQLEVLRTIDKLDKVGEDNVLEMLAGLVGRDRGDRILASLKSPDLSLLEGEANIAHLKAVVDSVRAMGYGDVVTIDLSIARGLDYYTGTVFETMLLDLPAIGSVASGGRYDGLLEMFGVPEMPAVGISIGVDRLFAALFELDQAPKVLLGPLAVVCMMGEVAKDKGLALLASIREAGIPAEAMPEIEARLKRQLEYAARRGARFAVIIGDSEVVSGTATIKDLSTGVQRTFLQSEVPKYLAECRDAN